MEFRGRLIRILLVLFILSVTSNVQAERVSVAFSLDIPPYIIEATDSGIEVDIFRAALSVKGHTIKPMYLPLSRIPLSFKNNYFDAAMSDAGNDLSSLGGYYGDPAVIYTNVFFTLKKNNYVITQPSDLDGLRVVSFQGASARYPNWLNKVEQDKRYYGISDQSKQVKLLYLERYDVVLSDRYIFKYFINRLQAKGEIGDIEYLAHTFDVINEKDYRPVFKSEKIRDDFNIGLEQIKATGEYQAIFDRYMKRRD